MVDRAGAQPYERFVATVARPAVSVPLDEATLCIAAHAEPSVDVDGYLRRLDAVAEGVRAPTLDGLVSHLFSTLRFTGNRRHYYDPRNSFLNHVLDRRIGIPITLSVVVMEVGRRIGVPVAGVGMPGHFLVRDKVDPDVFVDPFDRGQLLDAVGCRQLFEAHGRGRAPPGTRVPRPGGPPRHRRPRPRQPPGDLRSGGGRGRPGLDLPPPCRPPHRH